MDGSAASLLKDEHRRIVDDNLVIARRFIEEVLNGGDLAVADELLGPGFVEHHPRPGQRPGRDGFKQRIAMLRTAFPDLQYTLDDEFAAADKVVIRVTARGTHQGELAGLAPTGRRFTMSGIVIFRIAGGKIIERWANYDNLSMLQQLGAVPRRGGVARQLGGLLARTWPAGSPFGGSGRTLRTSPSPPYMTLNARYPAPPPGADDAGARRALPWRVLIIPAALRLTPRSGS